MGITGTDVSKEAADMVLRDDNFSTIVAAVEEGRVIYDNLRRFVKFAVAGNIGKIAVMLLWPLLLYLFGLPLTEAVALLDGFGEGARILAGGTDLLTALKERWETPGHVIDLRCLPGLDEITYDPETGLTIGARVTVRGVETSPLVRGHYPALAYAASTLASIQIRNLATVAGNICRASPSADMPPILLALDASVTLTGPSGERIVSLDEFFTGPGRTVMARNEILTAIRIPPHLDCCFGAAYIKHSPRQAMDLAMVGVAAAVTLESGWITCARVALGAVAPTPRREVYAVHALRRS